MSTFYSKNKAYRDVHEDEYVFNALKNLPASAKDQLTATELKYFKNDSTLRAFVNHGALDKKRALLSKAGVEMVVLYVDTTKEAPLPLKKFSQLEKQFNSPKERMQVIDSIIAGNMFATSSREILSSMYLLAQNCHTQYYFLNLDYNRVASALEEVKLNNLAKFDGSTDTQKVRQLEKSRNTVVSFILAMQELDSYVRVHLKLNDLDVNILLLLYYFRDTQVEVAGIYRTMINYSKNSVRSRLNELHRLRYIAVHTTNKIKGYTIAELGIQAVCSLLEKVTHKALTL